MKPLQYISIIIAIFLVVLLYRNGNTVAPKKESTATNTQPMTPGERQAAMVDHPTPISFDSLLVAAKKKLPPSTQAAISRQENTVTRGDVKAQQALAFEALAKIWQQNNNTPIAAYYYGQSGKLENSEKKLNFAAHLLTEELMNEKNPNVKQWMAETAIGYYQSSLDLNPANDTARIDLASVYIDGSGETMKGIEQLLSIVRKNPKNIPANVILGRMAVESGQLDKAIERGNTILSVDKDNFDAHMFLAEAYKRKGDSGKAKELLIEAKKIMKNPSFDKDVDEYMKTF